MAEITILLERYQAGDRQALDEIIPMVYRELRLIALRQFRSEGKQITLDPTALVHEAYLKLASGKPPSLKGRAHFLAIASRLMRQILVDRARGKSRAKRTAPVESSPVQTNTGHAANVVALDDALGHLSQDNPRRAELIEMHYFGGMTAEESAAAMDISVHVVRKEVRLGQAWLRLHLAQAPQASPP
jgi:RNA polymerase sigma factor (TIGR02999 family)